MRPVNRYANVAERELKEGPVRLPIWNEALTEAGGVPDRARELYQNRRGSENLAIEEQHRAAMEALRKRREFNDSLALSFPKKNGLFGIGIILMLVLAYLLTVK